MAYQSNTESPATKAVLRTVAGAGAQGIGAADVKAATRLSMHTVRELLRMLCESGRICKTPEGGTYLRYCLPEFLDVLREHLAQTRKEKRSRVQREIKRRRLSRQVPRHRPVLAGYEPVQTWASAEKAPRPNGLGPNSVFALVAK